MNLKFLFATVACFANVAVAGRHGPADRNKWRKHIKYDKDDKKKSEPTAAFARIGAAPPTAEELAAFHKRAAAAIARGEMYAEFS